MLLALLCVLCVCAHAHEHKNSHHHAQQYKHDSGPVVADVPTFIINPDGPLTRSVSGQFRGSWMETRRGRRFQAYRGIRYAEPPIGALRFQPPKLKLEYEGEVDASEEGPACPLPAPPTYYVDEDCLTVNVYTPIHNATGPLPVIFFIHPGGFYSMTGRSDLAGPHYLLDRDVVLVTINYRIGSLGFMSTGDAFAPGNNGMKDQVAALKWVQRNIAAFGGDPNLVTITGCSAGSISVMLHMISPMTKGLFHRGIAMSASPVSKDVAPLTHQRHLAVRQAEILNCPSDNSSIILACLMTKPWRELGDSLTKFWEFGPGDPVGLWGPVLEPDFGQERYLTINPLNAIKEGKMHTVPFIVSQTTDEFFWKAFPVLQNETLLKTMNEEWERIAPISFILPKDNRAVAVNKLKEVYLKGKKLVNDKESEKALGRLYGDSVVGFGVHRMANLMCRHSKHPVWYYEFAYIGNNSHYEDPNGKPQGAAHHDDLLYVFTLSYRYPTIPLSSPHAHVVDEMSAIWYNFARYGKDYTTPDTELSELSESTEPSKPSETEDGPIAQTLSGQFRGSWMETRRGRRFQAYRGIRYAEPPVDELRFQPPKPILEYNTMVDASKEGPACPAPTRAGYYVDEDCLTINVYTPGLISSKLFPVIFFIHPGGFYSFSGRSDVAGPHYQLDRDVVLVTINYRLGSLGFLALGNELAPGNNGFKDQVVALRWVKKNIAGFGGDPNLVTIAGCSAGAVSVMVHMVSPMSKGLFHRGISVSGSATSKVPSPPDRLDLAVKQARTSGCPEDNSTELYECLKTKSWREIAGSLLKFFEFGFDPLTLWRPVVEPDFGQERFLTEEPMDSIREGRIHSVPFMITQTTGEFFWKAFTVLNNQTLLDTMNAEWSRIAPIAFILPRNESSDKFARLKQAYLGEKPLVNDTATAAGLGTLYGDAITGFPVHRMANLMCRHSSHPVYYAEFAYVGNNSHYKDPVTDKPVLAAHHDDLIYLFSLSYRFPMIDVADTLDSKMVDKMTALWYNFAKNGYPVFRDKSPELSSVSWPAMKPAMRNYLRIDKEFAVQQNLFEDRFKVWDELYPIHY